MSSLNAVRAKLTVWVDDADAACEHVAARRVELLNGPLDRELGCGPPRSRIRMVTTSGRSRNA